MTVKRKLLCVPAGMPRSLEYLSSVDQKVFQIVGASSEKFDPSRRYYEDWCYLPHISDSLFSQAFISLVEKERIELIFTPHQVVWNFINELIQTHELEITLVNQQPILTELAPYHQCLKKGLELANCTMEIATLSGAKEKLLAIQYASLIRHARSIPGETDEQKIAALCEVTCFCPPGDIVEIGVLWGKSAFVLAFLAKNYQLGSVLCIDPWSNDFLPQGSDLLMKYSSNTHDISTALSIFQMNLMPYNSGDINYLQLPSEMAYEQYCTDHYVNSEIFGNTHYTGLIALLHIDGNHAYDFVNQDLMLWQQKVCNGGWVVMDDYCWKFGDGPQRAVDEFISDNSERIQCAFVAGGALFFQFV